MTVSQYITQPFELGSLPHGVVCIEDSTAKYGYVQVNYRKKFANKILV